MDTDLSWLSGRTVTSVQAEPHSWHFGFSGGAALAVECPWRIISKGSIALGSVDHQQKFGLAESVDAAREARSLLAWRKVVSAQIRSETCDLAIVFAENVQLELFNGSAGYEGWSLSSPEGRRFIAQGGGQIALM